MGIFDFVKNGVQRMMIARPDPAKESVVYKHPDQNIPFWTQLTVDSDEIALFFKDGSYVGTLGPGRHTLDTQNIPFLGALIDKFTGGNVFISELYFVTVRPLYNQTFGGPIGSMRDPELEIRVNPRAFGTYSFRVADPARFVAEFVGQTGAADAERAMQWVRDQLMMGVRTTLTALLRQGQMTMMDFGTAGPEVAAAIVRSCPDLSRIGVAVLEVAKLNLNLSDEDQTRVDQFQDQIVQAKIDARKAKIGISQAEAEVAAKQLRDQQVFANRAQYVNQLDLDRYRQYAAAEAAIGMGQGLSSADGSAAGLAGAAVATGAGLAAGMHLTPGMVPMGYGYPSAGMYPPALYPGGMYPPAVGYPPASPGGFPAPMPPHGGQPPSYPSGAPVAAPIAQPGYPAAHPGAAGGGAVGAPAAGAPLPASCPGCASLLPSGARFCSNCGRPQAQ